LAVVADQVFKYGEQVAAVVDNTFEQAAQMGLPLGFPVPLGQHRCGHRDIPAELVGRMPAQKKAVKKGRFALRELEVLQSFVERIGLCGHCRKPQFTDFGAAVKSTGRVKRNSQVPNGHRAFGVPNAPETGPCKSSASGTDGRLPRWDGAEP